MSKSRTQEQIKSDIKLGSKICTQCKERKKFEEFHINNCSPDKRNSKCKDCANFNTRKNLKRKTNIKRRTIKELESDIKSKTKICKKCNIRKSFDEFYGHIAHEDGKSSICKKCDDEQKTEYIKNNRNKINSCNRRWRKNNPKLAKASYKRSNKKQQLKRKTDPLAKLRFNLSQNLRVNLQNINCSNIRKNIKTFQLLGYSKKELYNHMLQYLNKSCERCSDVIITINNMSIDHIIPSSIAKTLDDVIELNQLNNLRLICSRCNSSKGNRIE